MTEATGSALDRSCSKTGERIDNWQLGRVTPTPSHLPLGWELLRLTSVAKLESGHTPSRRRPDYWVGDIPWISLHDVGFLDVPEIHFTAQTIGPLGLANSSARLLPQGTVIFSRTATVGKACIMGRPMATSQDFANYICGPRLHNRYLMQLFRNMAPEWKRLMAGSTHNSIYMPVFRDLQILVPPIAEQEAIAEALSDADALIESLEQLIAKKRHIKQGAMQELLTGKTRLPGFSGKWETRPLALVAPLQRGFDLPNPKLQQGPYPVVYSNGILNYHAAFQVRGPGVVTGRSGTIGNVTFVEQDFWPHNTSLWVTTFKGNDPKFVFYLYTRIGLQRFATGSGVPTLNRNDVHDFKVKIPPNKAEQTAIAAILSDMDAEIAALETKLAKSRQIKQGMMHNLLTGRIRLV